MPDKTQNTLESGTYEIIKNRLQAQRLDLANRLAQLNEDRKQIFSSTNFTLRSNQRITTENTCTARGIVSLGNYSIFAYNVHFGLREDIKLSDVFSVYVFDGQNFTQESLDIISNEDFVRDYQNLYKYYRDSIFTKFRKTTNYLYMIFQTSKNPNDLKAFKWLIRNGELIYQDDRSIHEVTKAPQHEFEWIKTNLEDRRLGVHPHISILDKVFIEALNGDITFKIEDNTDTGLGIYSESVENRDQQLDDADYYYADLGNIIAIRVKPFQEGFRAYIFNQRTKEVFNIKALNDAGVLLPDNQGLIFPSGYYLQNGIYKLFDNNLEYLEYLKKYTSPNGEDFLYTFYQKESNTYILMSYNIINQEVETPIICNGFTIYPDGVLIYFRTENEATRHHQVQIWDTPYQERLVENPEKRDNAVYKIGNKDIVKAMAEANEVIQLINKEDSYEGLYEDIAKKSKDITDSYFWIKDEELYALYEPLNQINTIANSAIDEFVKVQEQKKYAEELVAEREQKLADLQFVINSTVYDSLDQLVKNLAETRQLQAQAIELENVRYADIDKINALKEEIVKISEDLSEKTINFLLQEEALVIYETKVTEERQKIETVSRTVEAREVEKNIQSISSELELLIDILNSLKIGDPVHTAKIIEKISLVFSALNETRARLQRKISSLRNSESVAEFTAQLTLLEQSIVNYIELSNTPDKTDEYYTKISVQIEELESKFSDHEDFILAIAQKRDDVIKAFDSKKIQLIEQINRRTTSLEQIGLRVLKNIENKARSLKTSEEIHAFYSTDLMIDKIRQLAGELKELNDVSKAENLENQLKTSLEDALRILKDRTELFVDGENIIALGNHKFAVNRQPLSLTIIRRNQDLFYHLTGTSFYKAIDSNELELYRNLWEQQVVSENQSVYKSEYLAYQTYLERKKNPDLNPEQFINQKVEQNYDEAYLKGVNDFDALQIYNALVRLSNELQLLSYPPKLRATAQLFWHSLPENEQTKTKELIQSAGSVLKLFPNSRNYTSIIATLTGKFKTWKTHLDTQNIEPEQVAAYLFKTFTTHGKFVLSQQAENLKSVFMDYLLGNSAFSSFESDISNENFNDEERFLLIINWLSSLIEEDAGGENLENTKRKFLEETAAYLLYKDDFYQTIIAGDELKIDNLKGTHPVITDEVYTLNYHSFIEKLKQFTEVEIPNYKAFNQLKETLSAEYAKSLKVDEFEPRVLTSFIRNKLINSVYFPLIGANLSKQLGTAGENKRTARMGMLLLISPPGYGKTTLMEYLAKTMGLHFVKINGPTIGHHITSIDPTEAKTSGAREELKKINLSFEMADNVMLYLDDIQHLSPEFLQQFISLADGQRKMDGIFEGESKTYDLRGNRFCVVMAGNPYTESGSKFRIPDMLSNRADIYNLGDVIGNTEALFNLSLLENSAAENQYIQKITNRSFADFYKLIDYIETKAEDLPELEGNYLSQDVDSFIAVMKNAIKVRDVVVRVNAQYIASAAMQDAYRVEPSFKMQGSYRNMGKMAGQIIPLMNEEEIDNLIISHYEGESQTLTSDTEANFLKLKEIAGQMTNQDKERWEQIKEVFQKNNKLNGLGQQDKDGVVLAQLVQFNENLEGIKKAIKGNFK